MNKTLQRSFYLDGDVTEIAKKLLGKVLHTHIGGHHTSGIIVETEAYRGADDKGCHAFKHGMTQRTKSMFEVGGTAYVYICYGMHPMFNIVTGPENQADAVLIRAIEPKSNIDIMSQRRNIVADSKEMTNGPGKTAISLGITKSFDGIDLTEEKSPIWLGDDEVVMEEIDIVSSPRVGMSRHVAKCSHLPWRFYLRHNQYVSKPLHVDYTGKW